jgi:hypothetical protein
MCSSLDMAELSHALDEFAAALDHAKLAPRGVVKGTLREELLAAYDRMVAVLPRAFELGTGRESIIVQLLLQQVQGVGRLTLEKLYRAGLHDFETFFRADARELAAVAGIEVSLAEQIVKRFRDYRKNVSAVLAEPVPAQERTRITKLLDVLREQHTAFERASRGWSAADVADKRRLRRERAKTQSDIYVALTRLGEGERVSQLQKLTVERQLDELEQFLRQFPVAAPQ